VNYRKIYFSHLGISFAHAGFLWGDSSGTGCIMVEVDVLIKIYLIVIIEFEEIVDLFLDWVSLKERISRVLWNCAVV
jgi:hypothetical protein